MPGAMHRMGVYLGLVEEDEQEYEAAYAGAPERTPARREEYAEARYSREIGNNSWRVGAEFIGFASTFDPYDSQQILRALLTSFESSQ